MAEFVPTSQITSLIHSEIEDVAIEVAETPSLEEWLWAYPNDEPN